MRNGASRRWVDSGNSTKVKKSSRAGFTDSSAVFENLNILCFVPPQTELEKQSVHDKTNYTFSGFSGATIIMEVHCEGFNRRGAPVSSYADWPVDIHRSIHPNFTHKNRRHPEEWHTWRCMRYSVSVTSAYILPLYQFAAGSTKSSCQSGNRTRVVLSCHQHYFL